MHLIIWYSIFVLLLCISIIHRKRFILRINICHQLSLLLSLCQVIDWYICHVRVRGYGMHSWHLSIVPDYVYTLCVHMHCIVCVLWNWVICKFWMITMWQTYKLLTCWLLNNEIIQHFSSLNFLARLFNNISHFRKMLIKYSKLNKCHYWLQKHPHNEFLNM